MMEFEPGVAEVLGYYVYELRHPESGAVLYVGKGCGNRVFSHTNWATVAEDEKSRAIRDIVDKSGRPPEHIVVAHGLEESAALLLEAVLIATHGLDQLANRVNGHGRDSIFMDVASLNARYAASTVYTDTIDRPTLFVSLNGGKNPGAGYPHIRNDALKLKDRTLGIWKVAKWRADKIRQVAGVYAGIVRVVYDVEGWFEADHPKGKRKRFVANGDAIKNSPLINARVINKDGVCITDFMFGKEKAYAGFG